MKTSKNDISEKRKQELCLQCMECCKVLAFPALYCTSNRNFVEFYRARECAIIATDSLPTVIVESVCPKLTEEGCSIYNKRPRWCREYDGRLDPVMKHVCLWGKEK